MVLTSSSMCKWLLIGDSLMVGFKMPHSVNKAVVGSTPKQTLSTLSEDLLTCPSGAVVISLGSNILYNNYNVEIDRISTIVNKLNSKPYVFAVPAQGKYRQKAVRFNKRLERLKNITFIPYNREIEQVMCKDDVHICDKSYKVWNEDLNVKIQSR